MQINRSWGRWLAVSIALVVLSLTPDFAPAQTGPVQYGYDELGRLVIVADGTGNIAIFNYDAVGNLLSLERIDPGQLGPIAIVKITPTQGRVGSAVSIFGKGFGATPAQNTVTFNGGAATVTSASPTSLRVTVPSTALDGPISVTAAGGTATSAESFHVLRPFTVTPNGASVSAGGSLQFSATNPDGSAATVTWAVNDLPWGTPSVGTISVSGLYTPPPYVNVSFGVTITATDQSDVTTTASVTATVLPRRLATAPQGVSVSFAKPTVANVQASVSATVGARTITNSLQTSVGVVVGGTAITRNLQTSVSAVVGGNAITKSLQTSVSVVSGGDPSAIATATPVSVNTGPVITSVSPATGARGATGLAVSLIGVGFTDATQVTFLRNNVVDTTISTTLVSVSPDGTQATLSIAIASGAATGPRVVQIMTPAGPSTVVGTGANIFTVQ